MGKKKKSKMGRPPVDNPKNVNLTIRLTAKEKKRLTKAAHAAEMSIAEYIMHPHRKGKA